MSPTDYKIRVVNPEDVTVDGYFLKFKFGMIHAKYITLIADVMVLGYLDWVHEAYRRSPAPGESFNPGAIPATLLVMECSDNLMPNRIAIRRRHGDCKHDEMRSVIEMIMSKANLSSDERIAAYPKKVRDQFRVLMDLLESEGF